MTLAAETLPRLDFEPEAHIYTLHTPGGGVQSLPSVTTILRAVGLINFDGIPSAVLNKARDRGVRTHVALHYLAEGTLDWSTVGDEDRPYVEAGAQFLQAADFIPLAMEHRLWHPLFQYAGTTDLVGFWHGQPAIADYKSGKASDVAADLQLAAYAAALREHPPIEWVDATSSTPIARVSVELTKRGTYSAEVYANPSDFRTFLACLQVYREQERRGLTARSAA